MSAFYEKLEAAFKEVREIYEVEGFAYEFNIDNTRVFIYISEMTKPQIYDSSSKEAFMQGLNEYEESINYLYEVSKTLLNNAWFSETLLNLEEILLIIKFLKNKLK